MNKPAFFVVALLTFCLSPCSHASAEVNATISAAAVQLAQRVEIVLEKLERPKKIVLGEIIGRATLKSSGGIGIRRALESNLKEMGFEFSEEGEFTELQGSFRLLRKVLRGEDHETSGIDIRLTYFDENGRELEIDEIKTSEGNGDLSIADPVAVFGDEALAAAGVPFEVSPAASEKERQKEIIKQIESPKTKIVDNQVRQDGPFGVEIMVLGNNGKYQSRPVTMDNKKRAFVQLFEGEEYAVKIINNADHDIACSVLVDSVNAFEFSKDTKSNKEKFLIRAGRTGLIRGWYIHSGGAENVEKFGGASTKAFKITGFDDGAANRVGNNLSIGNIAVQISAAWPEGSEPPEGESAESRGSGLATGFGSDIKQNLQRVKRVISKKIRSTMIIRYTK